MTPNPETLPEHMPLAQAATVMAGHDRKRMPVVGPGGVLVGMVSRYDLLKTVAESMRQHPDESIQLPEGAPSTIADLMLITSASVPTNAPVVAVLNALMLSPLRRVVVLDDNQVVQGIITDGDVLRRASRRMQPNALGRLVAWLSVSKAPPAIQVEGYERMASEIMSCPAITIRSDAPVTEGVRLMMAHKIKALPVVNASGAFVGMVNRAGLLAALSSPNNF
ncbi:CBS domain-containing protein [Oscillochloris trichoides DG-6]|uniref:CBS domain-containing protein n=1 Tax=Oscillochloris trichoides DG-6 TaxID=765420 RepID=E1ICS3_9CHLR|nr:CBS domain-containing protein [Oscillochloris trichoides DG-6]